MLCVDQLNYAYPTGENAMIGPSFSMRPGESVALLGENGAGKSTLLSLLCGLLLPDSGTVRAGGVTLSKKTLPQLRERVGLVFQNPDDQLFMPTVYDDAAFGLRNAGLSEDEVRARVERTLAQLGISDLAERPPYRLSGGEKRLCALATVLVMNPGLLLFDEPCAYLDARAKRNLREILPGIPAAKLIVTHDLAFAGAVASRALVLQKGKLLRDAPMDELLADTAFLEEAGLV